MKFVSSSPRRTVRMAALAICIAALPALAASSDAPGVPNFHIVNGRVLRGGQPSKEGFQTLAKMGVHTVLDLREAGGRSADENRIVTSVGMHYVNVPMKGMATPTESQISRALAVLNDAQAGPVFVHCRRGADRTGAVIACYRMNHDQITNQQALVEARGFGMSVFQIQIQHYVARYQPHGVISPPEPKLGVATAIAPVQP